MNGRDFTQKGLRLQLFVRPHIVSVSPPAFVAGGGLLPLIVSGHDFAPEAHYVGRLGNATQFPCERESSSRLVCQAPRGVPLGNLSLSVAFAADGSVLCSGAGSIEVLSAVEAHAVAPHACRAASGELVSILGRGFTPGQKASCWFGAVEAPASVEEPTVVTCRCPRFVDSTSTTVAVELPALETRTASLPFTVLAPRQPAAVFAVHPTQAPPAGGTLLSLCGLHLDTLWTPRCRIDGVDAGPPRVLSSSLVLCTAPPGLAGPVAVGLEALDDSSDGHWASEEFVVLRRPSVAVSGVEPTSGSVRGGEEVTVLGRSFPAVDDVAVYFGPTRAVVVSTSASAVVCLTPASVPDRALVRVSDLEDKDISPGGDVYFTYTADEAPPEAPPTPCFVHYSFPSVGPAPGGAVVTLVGAAFPADRRVHCTFSARRVLAAVLSSSVVVCSAPAAQPGELRVEVGVQAGRTQGACTALVASAFQYFVPPTVVSVDPPAAPPGASVAVALSEALAADRKHSCSFGAHGTVPAEATGADTLRCVVPPVAPANVTLHVEADGERVSLLGTIFEVSTAGLRLERVLPSSVPASGQTRVTVSASGAADDWRSGVECQFGHHRVDATVRAPGLVECDAPPGLPGAVTLALVSPRAGASAPLAFEYTTRAAGVVLALPSAGSVHGTTVALVGYGLRPGVCVFDGVRVPGSLLSSSLLRCSAPPQAEGVVTVRVEAADGTPAESSVPFRYELEPLATDVVPKRLDHSSRKITVFGANFVDSPRLACQFNHERIVAAQFVSAGELVCAVPEVAATSAPVLGVSNNGEDFYVGDFFLELSGSNHATSVQPSRGSTLGGTVVTIHGTSFNPSARVFLTSGNTTREVRQMAVVSSSELHATTPPHAAGVARIHAAENMGAVSADLSVAFEFASIPVVADFRPTRGPSSGGTVMTLSGSGFPVDGMSCRVGGELGTQLDRVSSTMALCVAPAVASPGPAAVEVSDNGAHFVAASHSFVFTRPLHIERVSPSVAAPGAAVRLSLSDDPRGAGTVGAAGEFVCRFGGAHMADATRVAARVVACTPPRGLAGNLTVALSDNFADFSAVVSLRVLPRMSVAAVSPSAVVAFAASVVTIAGRGFRQRSGVQCVFGAVQVPATVRTDSLVSCVAPGVAPGELAVSMLVPSSDGLAPEEADGAVQIAVLPAFEAVSLVPTAAPVSGGVEVTIHGVGFLRDDVRCCFGAHVSAPARGSHSRVTCTAPPHAAGIVDVFLAADCAVVGGPASGLNRFAFVQAIAVLEASPRVLPVGVSQVLQLAGSDFPVDGGFDILLGQSRSPCRVVDSNVAECNVMTHEAGSFELLISAGEGSTDTGLVLSLVSVPAVDRVAFVRSSAGNTEAVVSGSSFSAGAGLVCEFDGATTPCVLSSPTQCVCAVPDRAVSSVAIATSVLALHLWSSPLEPEDGGALLLVMSISPTHGQATGGGHVSLTGSGFSGQHLTCSFGANSPVRAVVKSPTLAVCVTPEERAGSVAVLSVSDGAHVLFSSSFAFEHAPVVFSVLPSTGRVRGGSAVTLFGAHFPSSEVLRVTFGPASSEVASRLSSEMLVTIAPPTAHGGNVSVCVGAGGDSCAGDAQFLFVETDDFTFAPTQGPASGGTVVRVELRGPRPVALCWFGDVAVTAAPDGEEEDSYSCVAPALTPRSTPAPTEVTLRLELQDGALLPPAEAFRYASEEVFFAVPSAGAPSRGRAALTVVGRGLEPSRAVLCRFRAVGSDPEAVPPLLASGHFLSSSAVRCVAPAASKSGELQVQVSTNGQDFLAAVTFSVVAPPSLTGLEPSILTDAGAGASVTVIGEGFEPAVAYECTFGSAKSTTGHRLSARAVLCDRPELAPGNYSVSIAPRGGVEVDAPERAFHSGLILQVVKHTATPVQAKNVTGKTPPFVDTIHPTGRPFDSSAVVTVRGSGFVQGHVCSFGAVQSPNTTVLSEGEIVCWTPGLLTSGGQALFLTHADADLTSNALEFFAFENPVIGSISPSVACLGSTSHVTVTGAGFVGEIVCRFGGHAVPGAVVSDKEARCSASSLRGSELSEGVVSVEVSVNGVDFAAFDGAIRLIRAPEVTSVGPSHGPASGGSTITLRGVGFADGTRCSFGATEVPATLISSSEVTCLTPPASPSGSVVLTVLGRCVEPAARVSAVPFEFRDAVELFAPLGVLSLSNVLTLAGRGFGALLRASAPECVFGRDLRRKAHIVSASQLDCDVTGLPVGRYDVDFAMDGVVYSRRGVRVMLTRRPKILSIEPTHLDGDSSETVTIKGAGFLDTTTLVCRFSRLAPTSAVFQDSTRVLCVVAGLASGNVSVAVSNDGSVFSHGHMATVTRQGTVADESDESLIPLQKAPEILRVQTSAGPFDGGSIVTVVGSDFSQETEVAFSGTPVDTTFVSDSHVVCISPPHKEGLSAITVSTRGLDFVAGGADFLFVVPPTLRELLPARRLLGASASTVTVIGAGFEDSETLSCKFGTQRAVPAAWQSSSRVVCASEVQHTGQVAVQVSNDAMHFSAPVPLLAPHIIRALHVSPSRGTVAGGSTVSLALDGAAHLAALVRLRCVFGIAESPAELNDGGVTCTAPPAAQAGAVRIGLRSEGVDVPIVDAEADESLYTYVASVELHALVPSMVPPPAPSQASRSWVLASCLASRLRVCLVGMWLQTPRW